MLKHSSTTHCTLKRSLCLLPNGVPPQHFGLGCRAAPYSWGKTIISSSSCLPFLGSEAFHTHLFLEGPPSFIRPHPLGL